MNLINLLESSAPNIDALVAQFNERYPAIVEELVDDVRDLGFSDFDDVTDEDYEEEIGHLALDIASGDKKLAIEILNRAEGGFAKGDAVGWVGQYTASEPQRGDSKALWGSKVRAIVDEYLRDNPGRVISATTDGYNLTADVIDAIDNDGNIPAHRGRVEDIQAILAIVHQRYHV